MNLAYEPRASTVLYNLLVSRENKKPYILPANICPIVPITFFKAGVGFEFIDISSNNLGMDLDIAFDKLKTGRFGGLLYAHTYGESSAPVDFFAEAKRLDVSLSLIDDCCLCPPAFQPDADSVADATLFSTGYGKVVELGFGGYAFYRDGVPHQQAHLPFERESLARLESAYKPVISNRQPFLYQDSNWLETERAMPAWDEYIRRVTAEYLVTLERRHLINNVYRARLPEEIQLPEAYQIWRFNILVSQKQAILDELFAAGLYASSHYASLAAIMAPGDCPVAEKLAGQVINLFNNHGYSVEMAEKTCDLILKCLP